MDKIRSNWSSTSISEVGVGRGADETNVLIFEVKSLISSDSRFGQYEFCFEKNNGNHFWVKISSFGFWRIGDVDQANNALRDRFLISDIENLKDNIASTFSNPEVLTKWWPSYFIYGRMTRDTEYNIGWIISTE